MKLLVETTGPFQIVDLSASQRANAFRPSVVTPTTLIQTRISERQIDVLAQVSDEATDAEFAQYWKESEDRELAIESFKSAYTVEPKAPKQAPAPKEPPAPAPKAPARKAKATS